MKTLTIRILIHLILLILLMYALPLSAQSQQGAYLKVDYLLIEAEDTENFLYQLQNSRKLLRDNQMHEGEIIRWQFYKVIYPGSHGHDYNYISVTVANSLSAFETNPRLRPGTGNRNSGQPGFFELNGNIRHSELWRVKNSILKSDADLETPSRYLMIDYMEVVPGREFEYQMFEDEVAKPLHEERMNLDRMDGWELYELIMPGGLNYGYNFATGNYFRNLEHIEFGFTDELIRQTHPDTDIMEFFETIFETRDLVQSELWELVEYAE
ncbi:MAG: hypothetical protein WD035_09750 [Balneolaceae bacterium]